MKTHDLVSIDAGLALLNKLPIPATESTRSFANNLVLWNSRVALEGNLQADRSLIGRILGDMSGTSRIEREQQAVGAASDPGFILAAVARSMRKRDVC